MDDISPMKEQLQSNAPLPLVFIPEELIAVILSLLNVKTVARLSCVCKSWKSLFSNPTFIQKHLYKSVQKPHLILTHFMIHYVCLPMQLLLDHPSIPVAGDTYNNWLDNKYFFRVIGSCNGLLCLLFTSNSTSQAKFWLRIWNPATRTLSEELGFFHDNIPSLGIFNFNFGCDYLTGTYKVVALRTEKDLENKGLWRRKVRIFNLGDKCWRNILCPPVAGDGVHLSGTVNWLTIPEDMQSIFVNWLTIPFVEIYVIVSLDLSTEIYTQFLLPSSINELPCVVPSIQVLMDCLSFSHDFKKTEFVIWQMKEFGVQESWTRLFRIEYVNLQMQNLPYMKMDSLLPLYISKNGETLILLINDDEDQRVIIYNQRDKRVERTRITNERYWYSSFYYVESLVSTPWKSITSENDSFLMD